MLHSQRQSKSFVLSLEEQTHASAFSRRLGGPRLSSGPRCAGGLGSPSCLLLPSGIPLQVRDKRGCRWHWIFGSCLSPVLPGSVSGPPATRTGWPRPWSPDSCSSCQGDLATSLGGGEDLVLTDGRVT